MVFLALECFTLLLISYQVRVNSKLTVLEKTGLVLFSPFQKIADTASDFALNLREKRKSLSDLRRENSYLKQKVSRLELLEYTLKEARRENRRLRKRLKMNQVPGWDYIHCDVIGRTRHYSDSVFIINKGSRDGLKNDQGVLCNDGVVGIVWETGLFSSKVITLNSPGAVVAVMIEDSQYMDAFSAGKGGIHGKLENIPNYEQITVGGRILTSGMDALFPKGIPVAVVSDQRKTSQMFQDISIRYLVDLARIQEVTVIQPSYPEEVAP